MTDEPLLLRHDDAGVTTLTLNRPSARNALSIDLLRELDIALTLIDTDPDVRVVIIAGSGPGFCAGHDLRQMRHAKHLKTARQLLHFLANRFRRHAANTRIDFVENEDGHAILRVFFVPFAMAEHRTQ